MGAVTLSRFYSVHVLLLPLLAGLFIFVHLVLVIWHGVGVPAKLWHSGLRSKRKSASIIGESPQPDITAALEPLLGMSPLTVEQEHERYLAFKARGPRFWPHVIGLDSIASLLVFMLLVVLTVTLGVPTESRADPTDTSYIPRPEWYFMSLFQLVKYFPGNLEWVGVIIIPSFFVLLLFLLPFISRKPERRPLKRPYGTGILTLILVGLVALTVLAYSSTPPSTVVENGNILTSQQLRGKQLVSQQGCTSCHVIGGQGGQKGPPLDGVGERMTAADIHFLMENPRALNPAASMQPVIPPLTHEDVEAITQYLVTLKGGIAK